ncbi:MAG: flagellar biosynthesis anti-sigma factor FlgM [Lachnospiraceae bacterium]|nr:flagellar biosynthesis anti-sigma factor FlgM [Lachnospiraceae bacterium]
MRVDALSQIQQIYGVNKSRRTSKAASTGNGRDAVEISSIGRDIQTAKAAVKDSPDIRQEKVAALKAKIQAGTYDVSGESFADKLMQKFGEAYAN